MKTRTHPTPLSIKIAVGLWLILTALQVFRTIKAATFGNPPALLAGLGMATVLMAYQAAALARLSRWPVLLHAVTATVSIGGLYARHVAWHERYPMLGPFAVILPPLFFLALTLPHWRKMNWALFGRPYRPREDQAEIFA